MESARGRHRECVAAHFNDSGGREERRGEERRGEERRGEERRGEERRGEERRGEERRGGFRKREGMRDRERMRRKESVAKRKSKKESKEGDNNTRCISDTDDSGDCAVYNDTSSCPDSSSGSGPQFSQASFDLSSFIGGIILVLVLQAGAFFAMRFLKTKDSTYETM
ncbi:hypothetical protein NFI96_016389 [Prochilodus magdalenae]|nr:hypothetical protein NFI96_016389 [Prochilodus magdalenae]